MSGLIDERPYSIETSSNITVPSAVFANPKINPGNIFELVVFGESGHAFRVGKELKKEGTEESNSVDLLMKLKVINLS